MASCPLAGHVTLAPPIAGPLALSERALARALRDRRVGGLVMAQALEA